MIRINLRELRVALLVFVAALSLSLIHLIASSEFHRPASDTKFNSTAVEDRSWDRSKTSISANLCSKNASIVERTSNPEDADRRFSTWIRKGEELMCLMEHDVAYAENFLQHSMHNQGNVASQFEEYTVDDLTGNGDWVLRDSDGFDAVGPYYGKMLQQLSIPIDGWSPDDSKDFRNAGFVRRAESLYFFQAI